jgi:hypothetical protein
MMTINDYAYHLKTKTVGKVIGYGHKLVNNSYVTTLKVLVPKSLRLDKKHRIIEDLVTQWSPLDLVQP